MSRISSFHSINESFKPPYMQVYHDNDTCHLGRTVPARERADGDGTYRICKECDRLNQKEPNPWL
jgi:hypothetical protein